MCPPSRSPIIYATIPSITTTNTGGSSTSSSHSNNSRRRSQHRQQQRRKQRKQRKEQKKNMGDIITHRVAAVTSAVTSAAASLAPLTACSSTTMLSSALPSPMSSPISSSLSSSHPQSPSSKPKKAVRFNEDRQVRVFARTNLSSKPHLWYSPEDTDRFLEKESCREYRSTEARTYNTRRRILFHYRTLKAMGSDETSLPSVCRDCSSRDRKRAHQKAVKLAQQVHTYCGNLPLSVPTCEDVALTTVLDDSATCKPTHIAQPSSIDFTVVDTFISYFYDVLGMANCHKSTTTQPSPKRQQPQQEEQRQEEPHIECSRVGDDLEGRIIEIRSE